MLVRANYCVFIKLLRAREENELSRTQNLKINISTYDLFLKLDSYHSKTKKD
jgi:hypothetical protein